MKHIGIFGLLNIQLNSIQLLTKEFVQVITPFNPYIIEWVV